jgi:hypothetical protein
MPADNDARDRALFAILGEPRGGGIALPQPDVVLSMMGAPIDPIWMTMGVYVLQNAAGKTTYCTAGLSNPFDPPLEPGVCGLGYELCMESADEAWAIDCLMTLLFYQLAGLHERRPGRPIRPGEWMPLRPALPIPEGTKLRAFATTLHAASPVRGESGRFDLVQLVGMTKRELAWLVAESVSVADFIERIDDEVGRVTALDRSDMEVPDVDVPEAIVKYCG